VLILDGDSSSNDDRVIEGMVMYLVNIEGEND
jgi:hypothetical protein